MIHFSISNTTKPSEVIVADSRPRFYSCLRPKMEGLLEIFKH